MRRESRYNHISDLKANPVNGIQPPPSNMPFLIKFKEYCNNVFHRFNKAGPHAVHVQFVFLIRPVKWE